MHGQPVSKAFVAVSLVLIAAALAPGSAASTIQENPTTPAVEALGPWQATAEDARLAGEVLALLNDARHEASLSALRQHPLLARLAYQHAREMAVRGSVTHHSHLYGVNTSTRFELAFPDVRQFGENVAVNRDPEALHRALMKSTGHRLNRMDPAFTHVGVAIARAGDYQIYLTEVFARVFDEAALSEIVVLYSELSPEALPHDEPNYGEVMGETVRIGPPTDDNPEFWTRLGIDAFDARRFAEAIELFSKSVAMDSTYKYAHYNLARAYLANGEPEQGLAILQRLTSEHPDDADAWNSAGTALLLLQRFNEAVDAFNQVLRLRARDAGSWYNLGLAHEMQGNLDTAGRAYRQALNLEPDLTAAAAALERIRR